MRLRGSPRARVRPCAAASADAIPSSAAAAVEVHRDDGPRPDVSAALEAHRVDRPRARVGVDEHGPGAGRSIAGDGRHDRCSPAVTTSSPCADAEGTKTELDRVGAGPTPDADHTVSRSTPAKARSNCSTLRAEDEPALVDDLRNRAVELGGARECAGRAGGTERSRALPVAHHRARGSTRANGRRRRGRPTSGGQPSSRSILEKSA